MSYGLTSNTIINPGIWQSHRFTPSTLPAFGKALQSHAYIVRAKKGETKSLADTAKAKLGPDADHQISRTTTTPVIFAGPYGLSTVRLLQSGVDVNILSVAGGSCITFVLPVLQYLIHDLQAARPDGKIELTWAVRKKSDLKWIQSELHMLRAASQWLNMLIRIFHTREAKNEASIAERKPPTDAPIEEAFVKVEDDEILGTSGSASLSNAIGKGAEARLYSTEQATYTAAMSPMTRHHDLMALVSEFTSSTVQGPTYVCQVDQVV